ncbi:DUF1801 domain-containing protein [Agreia sp. VKM Ac-1783]|uniref:DUF1801 domain-containing protein n=1 Tax=Agreia sp. VKM Ac-1783 TaxID=1938889 RepID=UPI000A2ABD28|nr:DUF1801 domain-containing protein [Agreia sp. VKM Ac-1783]SMQ71929.1 hypothetical protein SAMN06295943_2812 [Agreia sp. VKM Ac-1783]
MAAAGLSQEERDAVKERAKELREEAKAGKNREAGEKAVAKAIAEMPESDAAIAGRIHELVAQHAPQLTPKTWYSQPAYANKEGKVILFVQSAAKFKTRYCTLGFSEDAALDDGEMWPTSFAVLEITPAVEKRIADLIVRAAG